MAKQRDKRRDTAFEIWCKYKGDIQIKDIAKELDISAGTVRGWKSKDRWHEKVNGALFLQERLNKKGAPMKNSNAETTGEYKTYFDDVFDREEIQIFDEIDYTDTIQRLNETIKLYSLRERLLLKKISEIEQGIGISDRTIIQRMQKVKEPVKFQNKETGAVTSTIRERYKLVTDMVTEKTKSQISFLLKLEDTLTRIQDKKTKALMDLHELTAE